MRGKILSISAMEYLSVHRKSFLGMNIQSQRFLSHFLLNLPLFPQHSLQPQPPHRQQQPYLTVFQKLKKMMVIIKNSSLLVFLFVHQKRLIMMIMTQMIFQRINQLLFQSVYLQKNKIQSLTKYSSLLECLSALLKSLRDTSTLSLRYHSHCPLNQPLPLQPNFQHQNVSMRKKGMLGPTHNFYWKEFLFVHQMIYKATHQPPHPPQYLMTITIRPTFLQTKKSLSQTVSQLKMKIAGQIPSS